MNKNGEMLPNTFLLGAAKAGTTTLFQLLQQHPQVFFSFDKEPKYFSDDRNFARGLDWYCETYFLKSANYAIRAEATPHYLYWAEKVAPRISMALKGKPVKLIAILRNPIERAYSWYWNMVADGRETLPFMEAVKVEDSRIKENWSTLYSTGAMTYGYFKGGCYATQIQRFFEHFPREWFHIVLLDDLQKDQENTIKDILTFLGIDSVISFSPQRYNPSQIPRSRKLHNLVRNQTPLKSLLKKFFSNQMRYRIRTTVLESNLTEFNYPPMHPSEYAYLLEKFTPEIEQLSKLLDRDLSGWNLYKPVS